MSLVVTEGQSLTVTGNIVGANVLATNETRLLALENGLIRGESNKKYRIIACTIRNTGSGWEFINDSGHEPIGVSSLTNNVQTVTLNYSFTASQVVSLVCTPDEVFAQDGLNFGASVGTSFSYIYAAQASKNIGGYIYYDGAGWQILAGSNGINSVSFSSGVLTVNHDTISNNGAAANCRDGVYVAQIGGIGSTSTTVYIRDYSGALVTSPTTDMKIFFNRFQAGGNKNMNSISSATGNIWIFGIMEVE